MLQQQQLIELIRSNKVEEALDFAKSHVAERTEDGDEYIFSELERTLALLAFDEPAVSPFGDLMSQAHKQKVLYLLYYTQYQFRSPCIYMLVYRFVTY